MKTRNNPDFQPDLQNDCSLIGMLSLFTLMILFIIHFSVYKPPVFLTSPSFCGLEKIFQSIELEGCPKPPPRHSPQDTVSSVKIERTGDELKS